MFFEDSDAPVPHLRSVRDWLIHIFYGLCIGAADIAPGFSGGTMALILGIYENLIYAIKSLGNLGTAALFRMRPRSFFQTVSWDFLLAVAFGACLSIAVLSQFVHYLLSDEVFRVYLYSLFFGMIAASAILCFRLMRDLRAKHAFPLIVGILAAFFLTGSKTGSFYDVAEYDVALPQEISTQRSMKNYDVKTNRLLGVSEETLAAMLARGQISSDTSVYDRQPGIWGYALDYAHPIHSGSRL